MFNYILNAFLFGDKTVVMIFSQNIKNFNNNNSKD